MKCGEWRDGREREREGRGEMRRTKMGQTNKGNDGTERQTSRMRDRDRDGTRKTREIKTGGEDVSFPE